MFCALLTRFMRVDLKKGCVISQALTINCNFRWHFVCMLFWVLRDTEVTEDKAMSETGFERVLCNSRNLCVSDSFFACQQACPTSRTHSWTTHPLPGKLKSLLFVFCSRLDNVRDEYWSFGCDCFSVQLLLNSLSLVDMAIEAPETALIRQRTICLTAISGCTSETKVIMICFPYHAHFVHFWTVCHGIDYFYVPYIAKYWVQFLVLTATSKARCTRYLV